MTTTKPLAALEILAYIGGNYAAVETVEPIEKFSVFVGERAIDVEMHWHYNDNVGTIELCNTVTDISNAIPSSGNPTISADLVEGEDVKGKRIDFTVSYPYSATSVASSGNQGGGSNKP